MRENEYFPQKVAAFQIADPSGKAKGHLAGVHRVHRWRGGSLPCRWAKAFGNSLAAADANQKAAMPEA
ncbi:hypothetical protein LI168_02300 [Desulfovibrio desulfuricans]|uniref:hypothetical protein n=1 Tax=Desulfovibrio TaxID=872 RepID=UPI001D093753|nr:MULTISPECIES: hypothetical protein [Desulfovibrio]MCB6540968.1 hypothetical protein [Desulfovibrio desulfuricans]MCB6552050.1 hypothetical protein [Desulfovibrio desulfuricans]MCB6563892.1 hypothetical protein [Desulfovibrio desulfuricans]MCB7345094.1 hypothetical protein [Desulfovibrio desulfuricans]MCQ4859963.1 hypothetical protein [Desulfovibrio desulfuricans]